MNVMPQMEIVFPQLPYGVPLAVFTNPWMLLWGTAAVVPVVLHLWKRRQQQDTPWAAMRFLVAALEKHSKRLRLEQLILLAVRVLTLLLFALAVANPVVELDGGGRSSDQVHNILVLDTSYSMFHESDGESCFARARQLARELVERSDRGCAFSLLTLADPPQVIVGTPTFEHAVVAERIETMRAAPVGAKLLPTLARVERILAENTRDEQAARARVYFFSDLQRTTWQQAMTEECRVKLADLAERSSLTVIDVGSNTVENLAITSWQQLEALPTVGSAIEFLATVRNFGEQPRMALPIELVVDGRVTDRRSVDVPPQAAATVVFRHRFDVDGQHRITAKIADVDGLPLDDQRFLAVSIHKSLNVLCINGKHESAKYLSHALRATAGSENVIRVREGFENNLLAADLNEWDAVFVCNVARFGKDESRILSKYVRQGGGLAMFMGDQVQAEDYNRRIGVDAGAQAILPVRIGGIESGKEFSLEPRSYEHPIVRPFRGHESAGLLSTPIWSYARLHLTPSANPQVAVWFDKDPGIVSAEVGAGRVIVVATAASLNSLDRSNDPPVPWTAWATWPSFPPVVHEMLKYLVGGRQSSRQVLVGESIGASLPETPNPSGLTVSLNSRSSLNSSSSLDSSFSLEEAYSLDETISPADALRQRVQGSPVDNRYAWSFDDTHRVGFLTVTYDDPTVDEELFAVNVDTRESDLARMATAEFPSELQLETTAEPNTETLLTASTTRRSLSRWLLFPVLGLLLTEVLVVWLFSRGAG